MIDSDSDLSSFSDISAISDNEDITNDLDFLIVTRIPVKYCKFTWVLLSFANNPNNELYSPYISQLRSFSYKLKLVKYGNGFGLFHIYKARHTDPTIREPNDDEHGSIYVKNPPNAPDCFENGSSGEDPFSEVIEYKISVVDKRGRERTKWVVSFSHENENRCCMIGEYRSNSWKKYFSDVVRFRVCMNVIKLPETKMLPVDSVTRLEKHSLQKLSQDLKYLYDNILDPDVFLKCESGEIPANGPLLSARSSVFKKMICDLHPDGPNTLEIRNVSLSVMKRLVEFLYTGTIKDITMDISFEEVYDLCIAADAYKVLDLRKVCSTILLSEVNVDNASRLSKLADRINDKDMKSQVLHLIEHNF